MANHLLDAMPSTAYSPKRRSAARQASPYGGVGGVFLLWVAFSALILFWPDTLASLWERFLDWNLILQVIVGVLLLPWVVATRVWQSDWSTLAQTLEIGVLMLGTLITVAPRNPHLRGEQTRKRAVGSWVLG